MKLNILFFSFMICLCFNCQEKQDTKIETDCESTYMDYSNSNDQFTGGINMIPIETKIGTFNVYTKRVGNNPKMKVLLLHGGPGGTHEFFDCFDGYFPKEEIEYIYYDQLDSYYSDKPNDSTLWTTEHFVEEVEQVRKALNMDSSNFYLYGQSWGGILAMEYALKYQDNLKGLIISNMMSSAPEYGKYAEEVLGPQMPPEVLKEIKELETNEDYGNPRYTELLMNHYYIEHALRMSLEEWPKSVHLAFEHLNPNIYLYMQGPSEFGMAGNATLKTWDVSNRLKTINTPTLVIGATYDTMDPKHMEWMANEFPKGRFLLCPNGSHLAQYDDQKIYFEGLISFIKDVNSGSFN
ncbi:proline iminopeptidase-family hydrolase [Formosa maritima]|uniref:Alpha/beta fold hydrolase n=1 Tax=Formosa maritima TaxID=2592046 RepID=A0A5D0GGQ8_9FLAO|nr:proline iminopeptidase-family hydrolase [Formosa maritima]TYA57499.1 alpha/beta fold hydrolase [Formosa maritima]